jgi:two-component system response regulator PilR (NtrC family)
MQVKLLRAIQEKAIRAVGSSREQSVDVRILSATHKDLAQLAEQGEFRRDLYYRINVIELRAPSLRERPEDIPQLVEHILGKLVAGPHHRPKLDESALQALTHYSFPGNVRELENILERALTLSDGPNITEADLRLPQDKRPATGDAAPAAALTPEPTPDFELENYMDDIERNVILKALEKTRHNKTAAAELLGISFRALRYRLKKLGLE